MVEVYLLLFIISIITCVKVFTSVLSIESWIKLGRNIWVNPIIALYFLESIIDKV